MKKEDIRIGSIIKYTRHDNKVFVGIVVGAGKSFFLEKDYIQISYGGNKYHDKWFDYLDKIKEFKYLE